MIEIALSPETAGSQSAWLLLKDALLVLLGAGIAFGTSWFFSWRAERDHKLGVAYELFFEAQTATENVLEIRRVLTRNIDKVGSPNVPHFWQAVQISVGFDWSKRVQLNPAGLALLAGAGRFELVNELMELGRLHDLLLIITSDFARRQEILTERLRAEAPTTVQGTTVSMLVTNELIAKHAPEIMRVEDLLKQLLVKALEGSEFAKKVTAKLGPELRLSLNDKRFRGRINYHTKVEVGSQIALVGPARFPDDLPAVTQLFRAYAAGLSIDLGYQDFDEELASLPGKYAPPKGALLVARDAADLVLGCVAMRSLAEDICEMKRLYVAPEGRGAGLGRALAEAIIEAARAAGYREMRLDTLASMAGAQALYRALGFAEIAPYYETPVESTVFMSLRLS